MFTALYHAIAPDRPLLVRHPAHPGLNLIDYAAPGPNISSTLHNNGWALTPPDQQPYDDPAEPNYRALSITPHDPELILADAHTRTAALNTLTQLLDPNPTGSTGPCPLPFDHPDREGIIWLSPQSVDALLYVHRRETHRGALDLHNPHVRACRRLGLLTITSTSTHAGIVTITTTGKRLARAITENPPQLPPQQAFSQEILLPSPARNQNPAPETPR